MSNKRRRKTILDVLTQLIDYNINSMNSKTKSIVNISNLASIKLTLDKRTPLIEYEVNVYFDLITYYLIYIIH